jgi:hypothetical protein
MLEAGAPTETACWTKPRNSPRMEIVRVGPRGWAVSVRLAFASTFDGRGMQILIQAYFLTHRLVWKMQ